MCGPPTWSHEHPAADLQLVPAGLQPLQVERPVPHEHERQDPARSVQLTGFDRAFGQRNSGEGHPPSDRRPLHAPAARVEHDLRDLAGTHGADFEHDTTDGVPDHSGHVPPIDEALNERRCTGDVEGRDVVPAGVQIADRERPVALRPHDPTRPVRMALRNDRPVRDVGSGGQEHATLDAAATS